MRQICQAREGCHRARSGIAGADPVLLSALPILAPAKLAQYIKVRSSTAPAGGVSRTEEALVGTAYWAWGYFCATVSAVDEATIKAHIENQKWDEDDEGFKITEP
jgi:REP element-mobilizing transposase RayT